MAAFDLETTGVDVTRDRIVTACVATIDGADVDPWTWLLNPGVEIPDEAAAVHGVTTERARAEGLRYADGYAQIRACLDNAWADGRGVVIYNAAFDLSLMDAEGRRLGYPPLAYGLVIDPYVLDHIVIRPGSRSLAAACAHYGLRLDGAHTAHGDALGAARLAWRLGQFPRLGALSSEELMVAQERWYRLAVAARADRRRHQGQPVEANESWDWPLRLPAGAVA